MKKNRSTYKQLHSYALAQFEEGVINVDTLMTDLADISDNFIKDISTHAKIAENQLCIASLGSYARRQLAPYSDLDIIIIHSGELSISQKEAIADFTAQIWDSGAKPGIQLADLREIHAVNDDIIRTSYIDNSYIAGDTPLYDEFCAIVAEEVVKKGKTQFLDGKIQMAARAAEEYADSIYRLEPNLKAGKGGIRDINTVWWIFRVYYDVNSFNEINLPPRFFEAARFIFRLRAELHILAKRKYDILRREFQLPIAERWGYKDSGRYRAVENFMRDYYINAQVIADAATDILATAQGVTTPSARAVSSWKEAISLLSDFPQAGKNAHELLKSGALERFIPEFSDIICRMQYNTYHHYTVDEHTLIALSAIDQISNAQYSVQFGGVLDGVARKDLLAMAILLHDIGKGGYDRNIPHSESGAVIAFDIMKRLGYPQEDAELVARVIKEHLTMSQVSHRRDISSVEEISLFINKVKDAQTLDILYLLTYADMNALGGGKFTAWNAGLLKELYNRAKRAFAMKGVVAPEQIEPRYLDMLNQFSTTGEPIVDVSYMEKYQCTRLEVCARDEPELLRRIAGTLTSLRCNILSANITSPKEGVVVDTIDFIAQQEIDDDRIMKTVYNSIVDKDLAIKVLQKSNSSIIVQRKGLRRVQVLFDNESSSVYTVVDIFSPDRIGLLYDILGVFAEQKLDVRYAKISTDVDSVVDSFALSYLNGAKITDDAELERLKKAIYGIT